jgi:leader peptidase (prepilin peptidase)/N-methyltransferase
MTKIMNAKTIIHFQFLCPVILLSLLFTIAGSRWITQLFLKAQGRDILSFPEQIEHRAKFRQPLLFVLLLLCFGKAWLYITNPLLLFYVILAIAFLSFVTVTDFEQYVIFDIMLLPFAIIGLCYTLHLRLPLGEHVAAALGGGILFFLLAVVTKGAIGGGDIKLVAALGLWFGYRSLLLVLMYGLLAGGAAALLMLMTKQKQRKSYFAYGPYFALSGIGILLGLIPF